MLSVGSKYSVSVNGIYWVSVFIGVLGVVYGVAGVWYGLDNGNTHLYLL